MEADIYQHIGRRIREERVRRGWTQEQLAERAEMHLSFVGQIERGVKKPSLKTLKRIADVYGIKAGDLLDESPPFSKSYPVAEKLTDLVRDHSPKQQEFLYQTLREISRQVKKLSKK